jgi:hypothetical protein
MLVEALGCDPKVTVRKLGSLTALEARQFARLQKLGPDRPVGDFAARMALAHREKAANGR